MIVGHIGAGSGDISPDTGDIGHSLRCRSAASAYLSRTFSAGNQKTWTYSAWIKPARFGLNEQSVGLLNNDASAPYAWMALCWAGYTDKFSFYDYPTGVAFYSKAVFRDPTSYTHIVFVHDSTQATASDRYKLYVNGVRQEAEAASGYCSLNYDGAINKSGAHQIGKTPNAVHGDGYLSRIAFVDSQALTPSSFGYLSTDTNEWTTKSQAQVKAVVDAGGTNSFMLDFDDGTSLTTLGYDKSSKGNNWTLNNFSLTAGATYDWMEDVPGNSYATLSPLDQMTATISNGNLTQSTGAAWGGSRATQAFPASGKHYFEGVVLSTCTTGVAIGFGVCASTTVVNTAGFNGTGHYGGYTSYGGNLVSNGTNGSAITSFSAGEVLQIAADIDAGKVWFGRGNVWYNSTAGTTGDPAAGSNPTFTVSANGMFPTVLTYGNTINANFGQRPFAYTPPTGFLALCQRNLNDFATVAVSGSFTGNANANGPYVWMNGVPNTLTINGNAVTFGTHADKLAGGFKLRTASTSYNSTGTNTWTATIDSNLQNIFKYNNAEANP